MGIALAAAGETDALATTSSPASSPKGGIMSTGCRPRSYKGSTAWRAACMLTRHLVRWVKVLLHKQECVVDISYYD